MLLGKEKNYVYKEFSSIVNIKRPFEILVKKIFEIFIYLISLFFKFFFVLSFYKNYDFSTKTVFALVQRKKPLTLLSRQSVPFNF